MRESGRQTAVYEQALLNPIAVYSRPVQVLNDARLSDNQKLMILRRWEADCRELEVAEEEGMIGADADLLGEVLQAMHKLIPVEQERRHIEAPTKQGGSH
ncbi:MAG TPA: hypothetical protein VIR60_09545 [Gammaproteobacteria bacterium]